MLEMWFLDRYKVLKIALVGGLKTNIQNCCENIAWCFLTKNKQIFYIFMSF